MTKNNKQKDLSIRPPVVAVVGHVDHGKTTLLDRIRHADVASREHGGITQHIGAYQISYKSKDEGNRLITFIDTPGHEAFAKMRSRGARVADIAILVVAADDSVKPQTVESWEKIREANIPVIVAANKIDLPAANLERVKKDLAKIGIQVEGFGGEVPMVPVSAKAGTGIDELLDMILLVWQLSPQKSEPEASPEAVVVETRLDKGKGMVSTIIVKKGQFRYGIPLFENEKVIGKVRALYDEYGERVEVAGPSKPVEVLGFSEFPHVGATITAVRIASKAREPVKAAPSADRLPDFLKPIEEKKELNVVLKADTAGSLEAVSEALPGEIKVVSSGIGNVTDADILLAKGVSAFVIGFNVKAPAEVVKLADTERVVLRLYTLIYELIDELTEVAEGIQEVITKEREMGTGVVIAEFPFDKSRIAGTKVSSGRLARGDTVRIVRDDKDVARAKIKSIRQGKIEVNKAESGSECGILFDKKVDFLLNDVIIAVSHL